MTASNRVIARLLLVLAGAVLLALAAVVVTLSGVVPQLSDSVAGQALSDALAGAAATVEAEPLWAVGSGAAALVLAGLLVQSAATRGRGRTPSALVIGSDDDRVTVSADAVGDVLRHGLGASTAVESLEAAAYRVSRRRLRASGFDAPRSGGAALLITATVRSGASPIIARRDVSAAIAVLDGALEREPPVVVHLRATRHRVARAS